MAKTKSTTSKHKQPVVVILGHVDHGKTTLLDYIRHSNLQKREAGGITQSIGAYQIEFQNQKITFIDTPGHAAFTKMRSQGAKAADLAILLVAANDGVKPQTIESISHLKQANIPFLVAINKIDVPGASADMVKAQLTEHQVFVEGYGGNVPVIEISAKTGQNVDELLENLLLLAELEELPYQPEAPLKALVIESTKDPRKGVLASVIIQTGTLKRQDLIYTATAEGKVRALLDENGRLRQQVYPGEPIQVLGFKAMPEVGELVVDQPFDSQSSQTSSSSSFVPQIPQDDNRFKLILAADTLGSLEAIKASLPEEVDLLQTNTGHITESDVLLAATTGAMILGFNVKLASSVKKLAEAEKVTLKTYRIIYELLEFIEKKVLKMLEPTIDEDILGEAQILKVFDFGDKKIAGCRVQSGKLNLNQTVHLKRDQEIIAEARIVSLKVGKEDVKKVPAGSECGLLLQPQLDIKEKDIIIAYNKKEETI